MRRKIYYYLGICIMICILAGCQKKETVQLEEVTKRKTQKRKKPFQRKYRSSMCAVR